MLKPVKAPFSVGKCLEDDLLRRERVAGHKMVCPGCRKDKTSPRVNHDVRQRFLKAEVCRKALCRRYTRCKVGLGLVA